LQNSKDGGVYVPEAGTSRCEMEREKIINIGPVCRFGPGGEFASNWPFYAKASKGRPFNENDMLFMEEEEKGVLEKLRNMFVGVIEALRGDNPEYIIDGPMEIGVSDEQNINEQGTSSYVTKERTANAAAGPGIKQNLGISQQSWLFADDRRAGETSGNKQNHGVRAHRAVAKKRAYIGTAGEQFDKFTAQGSLFDADLEDAKTA
jgi:hypothetical protein